MKKFVSVLVSMVASVGIVLAGTTPARELPTPETLAADLAAETVRATAAEVAITGVGTGVTARVVILETAKTNLQARVAAIEALEAGWNTGAANATNAQARATAIEARETGWNTGAINATNAQSRVAQAEIDITNRYTKAEVAAVYATLIMGEAGTNAQARVIQAEIDITNRYTKAEIANAYATLAMGQAGTNAQGRVASVESNINGKTFAFPTLTNYVEIIDGVTSTGNVNNVRW